MYKKSNQIRNEDIRFKLQMYGLKNKLKEHRRRLRKYMTIVDSNRLSAQVYYKSYAKMKSCEMKKRCNSTRQNQGNNSSKFCN